jgi:outer membrane protein assembly factor BamB
MKKVFIAIIITVSALASAQEATRWRGPEGNGIYPDKGLLREWPVAGPEMAWNVDGLGQGYSSPVFANGKIYITGMITKTGYVFMLSMDGKILDKFPYGEDFHINYPGSRSSPTIVGDLLYVLSGQGKVVCMNAQDGMIQWSRNLFSDFDGRNIDWGAAETLVVDETSVYCTPGGSKDNVVALDRFTGNTKWSSKGKGNRSAYCTPLLARLPAANILVTHTENNVIGIDASNGKLLWSHYHVNQYLVHPNTPIYHDGAVYCFSGYGRGGVMIELDDRGNKVKTKWTEKSLDSRMGGAVLIDGYIYGSGDYGRSWKCLDWETGKQMYESTSIGNGVVISADGLLFLYSQRGELALVPANPNEFTVSGKTIVSLGSGQHWAHPVIHDGHLYVRHGHVLMAYKIK